MIKIRADSIRDMLAIIYFRIFCFNGFYMSLRDEHKLRVSENEVLRKIFGLNKEEVRGSKRK